MEVKAKAAIVQKFAVMCVCHFYVIIPYRELLAATSKTEPFLFIRDACSLEKLTELLITNRDLSSEV